MTDAATDPFAKLGGEAFKADKDRDHLAKEIEKHAAGEIKIDILRGQVLRVAVLGMASAIRAGDDKAALDWTKLVSAQTGMTKLSGEQGVPFDAETRKALDAAARSYTAS